MSRIAIALPALGLLLGTAVAAVLPGTTMRHNVGAIARVERLCTPEKGYAKYPDDVVAFGCFVACHKDEAALGGWTRILNRKTHIVSGGSKTAVYGSPDVVFPALRGVPMVFVDMS